MYFLVKDDDLLEKCNTIWDKVSYKKKILIANLSVKKKKLKKQNKISWWWSCTFLWQIKSQSGFRSYMFNSN